MFLWKIFDWFAANPLAQWFAGIVAAYVTFRLWLGARLRRERKEARKEGREDVIDEIEEQTDEAIQRVEDERDAVRSLNEQQLRDLAAKSPHNRGRVQNPEAD
jgi:flagellar biosynthesis/type III secretory pathway M-ring protein FliF/YscJ